MSANPSQLDEIYTQVREYFISHPVISIRPTKGDPPDQYEITYAMAGISKDGEGQIVETTNHRVELLIPFGFPHFPPSCKPKSDIFHPDFDPAAICLGDFWEQDSALTDLVIHIGRLINGELYSTANAFNEDAADWYQENAAKFPLAAIDWRQEKVTPPKDENRLQPIDTLDESDLTTEFDSLSLETGGEDDEIILDTAYPEVDAPSALDLKALNQLASRKKLYTLLKKCENAGNSSKDITKLRESATKGVERAEKLHGEAKLLENQGQAERALEKFQQAAGIAADFPAIDADIHRARQTLTLLNHIRPDSTPDSATAEVSSVPKKTGQAPEKTATKDQTPRLKTAKSPQQATGKSKKALYWPVAGLILTGVLGGSGYFWYASSQQLQKATSAYAQCFAAEEKNQFKIAKQACDRALEQVGKIRFLHQAETERVKGSIAQILQSEKFRQGLAGNLLFKGKYLPQDQVQALLELQQNVQEADNLFSAGKWSEAFQLYDSLFSKIQKYTSVDKQTREGIERNRLIARFRMFYDPAQLLMQKGQWEKAIDQLLQAQKLLISMPEQDRGKYSVQLQNELQKSQFANLKEQGDLSFTSADWLSAIAAYNQALSRGKEAALSPESIEAIRNNIKRAEIYTTINKGNKAFAAGSWNEAIDAYRKASSLLIGNRDLPLESSSNINIQKLARIILQATIIRDRQTADKQLADNELNKARLTYHQILSAIDQSHLKKEEEFSKVSAEVGKALEELDKRIYLSAKEDYLRENYQKLFAANYPSSIPGNLTNPVVSHTRETGSKLIFRMQCTETGSRPLTLVMFYAYDTKTAQWSLFSEN